MDRHDSFKARAMYGGPPRLSPEEAKRRAERDDARLRAAIDWKVDAAMQHKAERVEAVLTALVAHCGTIGAAFQRIGRVGSAGTSERIMLDGREVWRGGWDWNGNVERPAMVWTEETANWWDSLRGPMPR